MRKKFLSALLLLFVPSIATATCHVVTPAGSGSKTGADWNNAYAGLPATLVRGDSYYLADGTYGRYTFTTATNGTLVVTIIKAIASDHCTDTGWNAGTMGSSQAIFTATNAPSYPFNNVGSGKDYLTINGNGTSTAPGCGTVTGAGTSDCGIKLDVTGCYGGAAHDCYGLSLGANSHIIGTYIEIVGTGDAASGTYTDELLRLNGTLNSTFSHMYMHDASAIMVVSVNANGVTLDHSYIWKNAERNGAHAQAWQEGPGGSSNITISNNTWKDIEGQGFIVGLNLTTATNFQIYGNTFYICNANCNSRNQVRGIVTVIQGAATGWKVYNNTIVNLSTTNSFPSIIWRTDVGVTGDVTIRNNLWYGTTNTPAFQLTATSSEDYDTFLNTPAPTFSGPGQSVRGAHDVSVTSGAPNPFTTWPADPGTFTLASENADWTGGVTLSSPYNIDPNGVTRGSSGSWNRGAYQYNSGTAQRPNPPQSLQVTSVQ